MPVTESDGAKDFTGQIQDALISRIGRDCFRLWFGQMTRSNRTGNQVDVFVAAQFAMDRISSRHMKDLRGAVEDVCGVGVLVELKLASEDHAAATKPVAKDDGLPPMAIPVPKREPSEQPSRKQRAHRGKVEATERPLLKLASAGASDPAKGAAPVKKQLTWESMVLGKSNKLAMTAARMVSDQPGDASPLFVWGPTGTGKTQLLSVLAQDLRRRYRMRRVISMTAEEFTNDFIGSVTGSGLPGFRRRYRDVDALIVDQVQFLPGKPATSREMLYTIDSALRAGKQLVFAADRPPMEINGLGPELSGRMSSGMVCAMAPHDHGMRTEILRKLCERDSLEISEHILSRVSEHMSGDGRLLSGVACRLKALVAMTEGKVTQSDVDDVLADLIAAAKPAWGFRDIQEAVCNTMGLASDALQSPGQSRSVSQARMLAMYLAREHTGATFGEIGEYFGRRSHSAVIAATRRIAGDIDDGKEFKIGRRQVGVKQMLETVESILRSG